MRHLFLAVIAIAIYGCKSSEGIDNEYSNLRTDGFYMAKSLFTTARPDTVNGVPVERNSMKILRFYNMENGVIIPENLSKDFQMTSAEVDRYYNWCKQYEVKNPGDKAFVNFRYQLYGNDSIKFSQVSANTRIDYAGKIYKDSIDIKYVLHPLGLDGSVSMPPKPIYFKFYPVE